MKKADKFLCDAGALVWPILLPRWDEGGPRGAQPLLEIQFWGKAQGGLPR